MCHDICGFFPWQNIAPSFVQIRNPGDLAEDCNCRCVVLTRARWELDASELQTLKDRAKFFGLDKTDSFKNFEKKYLKAAKTVEKSGKSGIIEAGNLAIPKRKLTGYALDPQKAPDKAKAFELALGYTKDNADELLQRILDKVSLLKKAIAALECAMNTSWSWKALMEKRLGLLLHGFVKTGNCG